MNLNKIIAINIYTLRNYYNLTQAQFAERLNINITRGHISKIENGVHTPSAEFIKEVCSSFNVSADWLLSTSNNEDNKNIIPQLSKLEINLLSNFRRLDTEGKNKFYDLIKYMSTNKD